MCVHRFSNFSFCDQSLQFMLEFEEVLAVCIEQKSGMQVWFMVVLVVMWFCNLFCKKGVHKRENYVAKGKASMSIFVKSVIWNSRFSQKQTYLLLPLQGFIHSRFHVCLCLYTTFDVCWPVILDCSCEAKNHKLAHNFNFCSCVFLVLCNTIKHLLRCFQLHSVE